MRKNKLTLKVVAEKIGVSQPSISKYCNGERRPLYEVAVKIEKLTKGEVTVKDLMERK